MPDDVERGDGPWGEAIEYWLAKKKLRQSDIEARCIELGLEISTNTISNAARGLSCRTDTLEKIAVALHVPLSDVLVSPVRQKTNDTRRQMIQEAIEGAMKNMEDHPDEAMDQATFLNRVKALLKRQQPTAVRKKKRAK